jgi:hypothetical protein
MNSFIDYIFITIFIYVIFRVLLGYHQSKERK